jgi:site-specific DNA recombinase
MRPYDPTDIFCARLRHRCVLIRAEHRLVENGSATPDASLVRLLVRAHVIRDRILANKSLTLDAVSRSEDIVHCYATRLFRLTLLAPDIVRAILGGKHPPELTARKLLDGTRLPLDWSEQRRSLGFA